MHSTRRESSEITTPAFSDRLPHTSHFLILLKETPSGDRVFPCERLKEDGSYKSSEQMSKDKLIVVLLPLTITKADGAKKLALCVEYIRDMRKPKEA